MKHFFVQFFVCLIFAASFVVVSRCATSDKPPTAGSWNVGNCMMMTFGARFTIPITYLNGTNSTHDVDLASWAMSKESSCNDQSAQLYLRFYLDEHDRLWKFILNFKKEGNRYKLETITIQYFLDNHFPQTIKNIGHTYIESTGNYQPSAKLGSYIGCDEVNFFIGFSPIGVRMVNVKMQPFVQSVPDGGFGTKTECSVPKPYTMAPNKPTNPSTKAPNKPTNRGSDGVNIVLVVVCVGAAIVAVSLIVAAVVFVVGRRNRNSVNYSGGGINCAISYCMMMEYSIE